MNRSFQAYLLEQTPEGVRGSLRELSSDDLDDADTLIKVEWSSINYKDVLAGTGQGSIARRLPLIGGIDLAGRVVESDRLALGTPVLVCGSGLSEQLHGGFAEYARLPGELAVELPDSLSTREAMGLGTAGLTAALAVMRLEHAGLRPEVGPVVVTGATGGVGSFAIDLLAARGYEVVAVTGAGEAAATWLKAIGAAGVLDRHKLEDDSKPLHRATWAAVVDNAGGPLLALLLKAVLPRGSVASIGLAGGVDLNTTVLPFILRGVGLLGINSVDLSAEERNTAWGLLAEELRPPHLAAIASREVTLDTLPAAIDGAFGDAAPGRTVVRIAS
ncbi:MAG: acryloyl-CoA reductase [Gammaproteobacteria bacterium]|jgi:NADPH2:quinone reductase